MIALVVFDLDGTLVDSHRDLAEATNALLAELGAAPLSHDVVTSLVGEGAAVLVRRALERAGLDPDTPDALERFLSHYDARLLDTTRPYAGMVETVSALRATCRLAVLTNKPERPTMRILEGLQMDALFSDAIGGDSPHGRKPRPRGSSRPRRARRRHAGRDAPRRRLARRPRNRTPGRHAHLPGALWIRLSLRRQWVSRGRVLHR